MNSTRGAAGASDVSDEAQGPEETPVAESIEGAEPVTAAQGTGRWRSAAVTVGLVLALWIVMLIALAGIQVLLNRGFGIDVEVGNLPGLWDYVLAFALVMVTWGLVRKRHPKSGR